MKIVTSDSPEVAHCLASTDSVRAYRPYGDFEEGVTFAINAATVLLIVAFWTLGWKLVAKLGVAVLLGRICILLWRGVVSRRHWIVIGCAERFYFQLFRPFGARGLALEPNVMELDVSELTAVSLQRVEIFIEGPKPHVAESLVVELEPKTQLAITEQFERLSPPRTSRFDLIERRKWFIRWAGGALRIRWKWLGPDLRKFLGEVGRRYPKLTVGESRSELDLVRFGRMPEAEQRKLLVQVARLGFRSDCISVLMNNRYKRMSMVEAVRYMAEIDNEENQRARERPLLNGEKPATGGPNPDFS